MVNAFRYDHLDDLVTHPSWIINLSRLQHRSWALNNTQLRCGLEYGLIDIPDVSSRLLTKLDRGDKLVKTLALLQITFLMTQLVARRVANYPSTQLEIATLAFSASSMITYVLYWSRPQGVESIYVMEAKKKPDDAILSMMMQYDSRYLWTHGRTESRLDEEMDLVPIRNDSSHTIYFPGIRDGWTEWIEEALGGHDEAIPLGCGAVVGGVLFGGLHCLAWDFKYPTSGEALAWKICSVLMTSLPILSIYPFIYWQRLNPRFITDTHKLSLVQIIKFLVGLVLIILLVTYILARLFLIVEIFLSLFFLPPEAFIDTWSGSFPHFTG